jgi:hypothetical protein
VTENSLGKRTPPSRVVSLAPAMRRVASATIELESHLTLPLPGVPAIVGSKPRQALLFESVLEYGSPMARVDSRTQESQRGLNGLSWFGPISALRQAADNTYTQKHPKSGVTTGL